MSSKRTKALFWLGVLPLIFAVGARRGLRFYSYYLTHTGRGTYFVLLHVRRLSLLGCIGSPLSSGLISLLMDWRNAGEK